MAVLPRKREPRASSEQRFEQIPPLWIIAFDQLDLPGAFPFLHPQFAMPCFLQILICLKPDQQFTIMVLGETVTQAVAMLICPGRQIAGDTQIARKRDVEGKSVTVR